MKKKTFLLSAFVFACMFLLLILLIPAFVSASVNISCSDNSKVSSDQNEIKIGNAKTINELGIGVTKTTESPFYKRVSADLLVDTKRSAVSNETPSDTVELLTGTYTIKFVKANLSTATISVDGDSEEIAKQDTGIAKGMYVMISEIEVETQPIVRLIIGSQKITLSNDQNPAQKMSFTNKSFVVEIVSASTAEALIRVSKCSSGEINLLILEAGQNASTNVTKEKQKTEEERLLEENLKANESTTQVSVAELNKRKNQSLSEDKTGENGESQSKTQQGFFSKIWNWLKSFFDKKTQDNNENNNSNITENNTDI